MSTIEKINGKVYFQFKKEMITMEGKKFVTLQGQPVDGRAVRGMLRANNFEQSRAEVVHIKSIMNRFFGGDANGNLYKFS